MVLLTPTWREYELIDTGGGEKLERFGKYVLRRPEPQAVWQKFMSETEWNNLAHATFKKEKDQQKDSEKGRWVLKTGMPEQWFIEYNWNNLNIKLRMGLTAFKHVGVFPEQAENWNFIYECIQKDKTATPRILNLFAYTGGASLAAKAAGADVVHVDAVRQVINWSAENQEASNMSGIRWVVEDVMKYIRRELKRGKTYHGIILDPPAYGRGPEGEKWMLEEGVDELVKICSQLLEPTSSFLIINFYSMGFSALIADSLVRTHFGMIKEKEFGELYFPDRGGRNLPLGTVLRFRK